MAFVSKIRLCEISENAPNIPILLCKVNENFYVALYIVSGAVGMCVCSYFCCSLAVKIILTVLIFSSWRRWYPYATLIHRESESESMDALAERLEKSMDCRDPVIIIRCFHLGELLSAWINTGYTVRDIASVLSLSSLVVSSFQKGRIPQALAATGFGLQLIHGYFWGFDRLSAYAIQPRNKLPKQESFKEINEVVLVRKPCTGNYLLRTAVTLCAVGVCGYFFYKDYVD